MKIVFANNYYYLRGGSEYIYFLESRLLQEHGHAIVPFSRQHPMNFPTASSRFFPPDFNPSAPGVLNKLRSALRLTYSFDAGRRFGELLEDMRPEIVHGHNIYGRLTTAIIDAARKRSVPFVLTLHDYKLICPSYLLFSKGMPCTRCLSGPLSGCIRARCHKNSLAASVVNTVETSFNRHTGKYMQASLFISPSRFLIDRHIEAGFPDSRFLHIPNAIDISKYSPSFSPGEYVLFAGRLSHEKGLLRLLEAFMGLDLMLRIAGEGPMRAELEGFASENKMKNVFFEGFQSGSTLADLYRGAMFTVMPSEWYENAPISLIESFAYGKPVIGAAIGGIPEMIDDAIDGLHFRPFDTSDLKEKISYLASNPARITAMGKAARVKAESRFAPETHYNNLIAAYKKAIG